jgi:glutathione synthase/RimK-type ligase-like ATP-grasp enzyme
MNRVVILTPNPDDMAYGGRWSEVRDRMVGPLAAEGIQVESRAWIDDVAELAAFDLVLPLTTWGYHREYDRWRAMADAWEAAGLNILNPPGVLRWNADKRYLGRLFKLGAPVVPTLYVEELGPDDLKRAAFTFETSQLIVKPQISASAYQTLKVKPGGSLEGGPEGPALIQPFLDQVGGEGELSLIFFEGRFSHAIRKVAAPGDFRTQPEWGGHISAYRPELDVMAAAERILRSVDEPLLYARVDMIRDAHRKPVLMELELIEPDLYLAHDPDQGQAFAGAVRRAIDARRG